MAWELLWGLLRRLLERLGFYGKEATIAVVGLDNAGKTTLLHRLMTGDVQSFSPTERAHLETFRFGSATFHCWDLGGHSSVRYLWDEYCAAVNGVVFMVDSADPERLGESARELAQMWQSLPGVPFVVLYNKSDIPESLKREDLDRAIMALPPEGVTVRSFACSVLTGVGFEEAFAWLAAQI